MKKNRQPTPAFTMLELVFVIVVLGILAALALPRMERDIRQEAADNILSAIRYTQHLALTDNKQRYDTTDWMQRLWLIRFETYGSEVNYKIGTDMDQDGNIDKEEAAIDPLNKKYLYTTDNTKDSDESKTIFLTKFYGISGVTFNNCHGAQSSSANHIAFDNKGRVHRGILNTSSSTTGGAGNDFDTYVKNGQCEITFTSSSYNDIKIIILEETGYAYIANQLTS
jgi:prepilin-type N-terminal cleavage/methylation domain-containing protein